MEQIIKFENSDENFYLTPSFNKGQIGTDKLLPQAIKKLGCGRSILVDAQNNVICGNGTLKAVVEAGIKKVRVIDTTGDELIVVRRTDVMPDTKKQCDLKLTDNLIASQRLKWDADLVNSTMDKIIAFDVNVWNGQECAVKELNISDLIKDDVDVKDKSAEKSKIKDKSGELQQLNLFE